MSVGTYVVEEVVSTGQLLKRLQDHAQSDSIEHAGGGNELMPLLVIRLGFELLANLIHLFQDAYMVFRDTVEHCQSALGTLRLPVTELVARALREECHTATKDQSEEECESQSDAPLAGTIHGVGTQVDAVGQEDTEGHKKLVATDHGTTDVSRSTFALIHRHEQRATTDAETSDPTANDHLIPVSRGGRDLNDQTNIQDHAPKTDGPLAAQLVRDGCSSKRTNHGTNGKQSDDETRTDCAELVITVRIELTIPLQIIAHFLEARDLASIITEQETSHGNEQGHDEGPHGDPRNRGINTCGSHGLLLGAGLIRGLQNWLLSRGDRLPMVGRRFNAHDGVR